MKFEKLFFGPFNCFLNNLFDVFKQKLSVGISNRIDAPPLHIFLITNLISYLRIYDLAEIVKVPNVAWSKFQTSKLGNKFLAIHSMKEKK